MAFLLFVVVLVYCNYGSARPMMDGLLETTSNGLTEGNDNEDKLVYKLPAVIEEGHTITIAGTLKSPRNRLTVTLHDNMEASENCKITVDFNNETIHVTPGTQAETSVHYNFLQEDVGLNESSEFSIQLHARVARGRKMLGTLFDVGTAGAVGHLNCDTHFDKINYIVIQEGVASVKSLMFEFGNGTG